MAAARIHQLFGRSIRLEESMSGNATARSALKGSDHTGMKVWDVAEVLCRHFEANYSAKFFEGKRVLELGAGCGLIGITLATLGAKVVMTDGKGEVLNRLHENIRRNRELIHEAAGRADVQKLIWGDPLLDSAGMPQAFDIVIGSDVIYVPQTYDSLLTTVAASLDTSPGTDSYAFIAFQQRNSQLSDLFTAMARDRLDITFPEMNVDPDMGGPFQLVQASASTTTNKNSMYEVRGLRGAQVWDVETGSFYFITS